MSDQNPPEDGTPEEGAAPPPSSPLGAAPPPPPPPPGYGVPPDQPPPYGGGYPPPPPGDMYGAPNPYAAGPDYSPTAAVGWGWKKFTENWGVLVLTGLALFAIQAFFSILQQAVGTSDSDGFGFGPQLNGAGWVLQIVGWVVSTLVAAGVVRACLGVTAGETFDFGKVFSADKIGPILIAAIVTGILTVIGLVLCILPGLVVIFFAQYVNYFIIDKDQSAVDAIKSSVSFVGNNLGPTLLYFLLSIVVAIAGALACLVGLLVALPVIFLGQAYTYRKLSGQPVSD